MKRREFITLAGGAAATWPVVARAQQRPMPMIGILGSRNSDSSGRLEAFLQGLREFGYVDGLNVALEFRWADGSYDRLPSLAADLVKGRVSVIVIFGAAPDTLAARAATDTIPIVFTTGTDPVELGLVSSLNRPGGNLTGVTTFNSELLPKRVELIHEVLPDAKGIAALINATNESIAGVQQRSLKSAAESLGLELSIVSASQDSEIDRAFADLIGMRSRALIIANDPFLINRSEKLAAFALRERIPAIFQYRPFTSAGGLLSYGGDFKEQYHQMGVYAGRILKGEQPAELPIVRSKKIELIINLKTASALGVKIPLSLLGRADEVIE